MGGRGFYLFGHALEERFDVGLGGGEGAGEEDVPVFFGIGRM